MVVGSGEAHNELAARKLPTRWPQTATAVSEVPERLWALLWALGRGFAHLGADPHGKAPTIWRGLSLSHTTGYGLRRNRTEIMPATLQTSALPLGYGAEGQQT
jgi:hypothetical protein